MSAWLQRFHLRLPRPVGILVLFSALVPACGSQAAEPGDGSPPKSFEGMIEIPAGVFIYGATEEAFQAMLSVSRISYPGLTDRLRSQLVMPARSVTLDRFYIDEFEVTNAQYHEFLRATGYHPASGRDFLKHWEGRDAPPAWARDFPVVWVSGEDGEAYCRWRGLRLPTDEEWERAARGVDGRLFPWGNQWAGVEVVNQGSGKLEPAGNRPGDRSPDGVYDLGGNVSELVSAGSAGTPGYIVRGGSYASSTWDIYVFYRLTGLPPGERQEYVGFRCAGKP
jgi:iron(II)-dependent oxidoreductase